VVVAIVIGHLHAMKAPAANASPAVTLTSSSPTVAAGSPVTLTATMPVVGAGTVTQEIVQQIDPTKVRLTGAHDIEYPVGWTLSYCTGAATDCSIAGNFSPTIPSSWADVKAVRASGPVVSEGVSGGNQMARGSATSALAPPVGTFDSTAPGLDPWMVGFDDDGRFFTQPHHKYGFNGGASIKCRRRDGTACPGWSGDYFIGTVTPSISNDFGSAFDGYLWVDMPNDRLWYPTWGPTWRGFACVSVAAGSAPGPCNLAGLTNSYVSFGTYTNPNAAFDVIQGMADHAGRLYTFDVPTGAVLCADIAVSPVSPCTGGSWVSGASTVANFSNLYGNTNGASYWGVSLQIIDSRLWVLAKTSGGTTARLACLDPMTGAYCTGWSTSVGAVPGTIDATTVMATGPTALPNASGQAVAVCARGTSWVCFTSAGASYPVPANFAVNVAMSGQQNREPQTYGTKIYSSNGNADVWCYDAATDAACTGFTRPRTRFGIFDHYTVIEDPLNPGCLWYAADTNGRVGTLDGATGGNCVSAPSRLTFGPNTVVPRLGCSATPITRWGTFTLTSPLSAAYTGATVDVVVDRSVVGSFNLANGSVDLSQLSVTTSGSSPTFRVGFTGLTGTPTTGSATVTLIGSAPELCLDATAVVTCPAGSGPVPTLPGGSFSSSALGSLTDSSSQTTSLPTVTISVTVGAPTAQQCGGLLTGRAGTATSGTSGDAVVGLTVALLDASGNAVLDGNGQPMTTTTDVSGNYTFGPLLPAAYQVSFPGPGTTSQSVSAALSSVTVATGGSGTSAPSCPANWTFDNAAGTCRRRITSDVADAGVPVGVELTSLVVGGGGGGGPYVNVGTVSRGGAGGQVVSSTTTVTGTVGVTIGSGGGPGATGQATSLTGGVSVSAAGGAGGGGSSPARAGTTSTLSGSTVVYGADGTNWNGTQGSNGLGNGTANSGNGGGAGSRQYVGAGCYEPGARHVFLNPGGPCGTGGTYENGGWSTVNAAGSGGSGVVVLSYPVTTRSNSATVSVGGTAVVNALYLSSPVARPNTSTGTRGATQTISPLADDTASTGATYSGGSTAVRLCGSGQSFPSCNATTLTVANEGTYTLSGTNVVFTPLANFTGLATPVTYQSTDSSGRQATSTITPRVVPPPTATSDTNTGAWNTAQTITVLGNDAAGTGATLSAASVKVCTTGTADASCSGSTLTVANQGTYTVNADGSVTFVPLRAFTGTATTIKYVVRDSLNQLAATTLSATVTAPPTPTAVNETKAVLPGQTVAYTTLTGTSGLGTSAGPSWVLTSAGTGLCGVSPAQVAPNCTQASVTISGQGTYTLDRATGVVSYTAVGGATPGSKTPVTYVVKDELGRWASAQLTPVVPGPPDAVDDTSTGAWDATQSITVLGNDTVSPGRTLDTSSVRLCTLGTATASCSATTLVIPGEGTYSVNANGVVSFDPLPTFAGTAAPITYVVADSAGQSDAATITTTVGTPPPPTATAEQSTVLPGDTITFTALDRPGGLANSGGPAFDTAQTYLCGVSPAETAPNCTQTSVTTSAGAYVLDRATGVVRYTAFAHATSGAQTAVTYVVKDDLHRSAHSSLTPFVPPLPTSQPDSSRGEVNTVQSVHPTGNDTPGQATTPLDPTTVMICAVVTPNQTPCSSTVAVTVAAKGVFTIDPVTHAVVFTPDTDYFGVAEVAYTVADSLGRTTTNTITVTVLPKPAPSAVSDTRSAPFGQTITFTPLTGTSGHHEADSPGTAPATRVENGGDTITEVTDVAFGPMRLCGPTEAPPSCSETTVTTEDGTYVLDTSTSAVVFTPVPGFTGTATTPLQYQISNTWTTTVTTSALSSPTATTSSFAETASAYLVPTVLPPAPLIALNDATTTPWNVSVSVGVAHNDASGSVLLPTSVRLCGSSETAPLCSQVSVSIPQQGLYTLDSTTGVITFTPLPTFSGAATPIDYSIRDDLNRRASATFSPVVAAPNGPSARPDAKSVKRGDTVAFASLLPGAGLVAAGVNVSGTNPVVDAATCLYLPGTTTCSLSNIVITADGTFELDTLSGLVRFTAAADAAAGPRMPITYRVIDSLGLVTTSALTPTVYAPPTVQNATGVDVVDTPQRFAALMGYAKDPATTVPASSVRLCDVTDVAPNCTALVVVHPGVGTFTVDGSSGDVTFTPVAGYVGAVDSVAFSVTDGLGQQASAIITPTVVGLPEPTAVDDTASGAWGSTLTFQPDTNDDPGQAGLGSIQNLALDRTSIRLCDLAPNAETPPSCTQTSLTTVDGRYTVDPTTGAVTFDGAEGFSGTSTAPARYQIANTYTLNGVTRSALASALLIPSLTAARPAVPILPIWLMVPPEQPPANPPDDTVPPSVPPSSQPSTPPDDDIPPVVLETPVTARPNEALVLNPATALIPSAGQALIPDSLRLFDEQVGTWSNEVVTAEGTWTIVDGSIRFAPNPGFTGLARLRFRIAETSNRLLFGSFSVDVAASMSPTLPSTGSGTPIGPAVVISLVGALVLAGRRRWSPT